MKQLLFLGLFIFSYSYCAAQLDIAAAATPYTIDFESTVADVNNGLFDGSGLAPAPALGQLDSDAWEILGLSDGALNFGGTGTTGDYARGTSPGGVSTGGLYAFMDGGSTFLGIQPGGSDWTPGTITLAITNNTGALISDIQLSYDIMVRNDQGRANTFNFAHSPDNVSFTAESAQDYTSDLAADATPAWVSINRTFTISGLNIADGSNYYLQWAGNDSGGSGSRDEFGLDNVIVNATNGTPQPVFSWSASTASEDENVSPYTATINVSPAPTSTITVEVSTSDVTTTAGADYTALTSQVVTFLTGETAQTVDVIILDDVLLEPDEDFLLTMSNNSAGTVISSADQTVTIIDDDFTCTASVGDIIVTEIMDNPDVVTDAVGEWFEVYNTTGSDIDMLGWELTDDGIDSHIINASVIVPAGGYAVLGKDANPAVNGGILIDYAYGDFEYFIAATDEIVINCGPGGIEIDRVNYTSGTFPNTAGVSKSLDFQFLNSVDNDVAANWCGSVTDIGLGDLGTPGLINDGCPPIYDNIYDVCSPSIGTPSNAVNDWVDLIVDGEIIASIHDMGNNLGTVTAFIYNSTTAREDASGTNYLNRTLFMSITGSITGADPMIRFYFKDAELQALITDSAGDIDAVASTADLMITHASGASCSTEAGLGVRSLLLPIAASYGDDHYLEFSTPSFSAFSAHGGGLVLPVELDYFRADEDNGIVDLQWASLSEGNLDYFEIEHSMNAIDFNYLSQHSAHGIDGSQYNHSHINAKEGLNYYRLKMMDNHGALSYSNIISVQLERPSIAQVIYDSITQEVEVVFASDGSPARVDIYDSTGRHWDKLQIQTSQGMTATKISIRHLPQQVYYVRINQGGNSLVYPIIRY